MRRPQSVLPVLGVLISVSARWRHKRRWQLLKVTVTQSSATTAVATPTGRPRRTNERPTLAEPPRMLDHDGTQAWC